MLGKEYDVVPSNNNPQPKPRFSLLVTAVIVLVVASFTLTTNQISKYRGNVSEAKTVFNAVSDSNSQQTGLSTKQQSSLYYGLNPQDILNRLVKTKYPECKIVKGVDVLQTVDLKTLAFYTNSSRSVPYDHVSCFLMKARYNCAYRPDAPFRRATDYELVLQLNPNSHACKLGQLIENTLQEWSLNRNRAKNVGDVHKGRIRHVLLQGNSYIRQIFEALVCRLASFQTKERQNYRNLITNFSVQNGGPSVTQRAFIKRHYRPVENDELGQSLFNITRLREEGCHGDSKKDISPFYRKRAEVPPNIPYCNDNVATMELDSAWAFSYIFKPSMYATNSLESIYRDRLGIHTESLSNNSTIEWLIWNEVTKEPQNRTAFGIIPKQTLMIESWLWDLRAVQLRDLGRYYGANNPWIRDPPDIHPCMPGIPDDEVNLLLYLVWTEAIGISMKQ